MRGTYESASTVYSADRPDCATGHTYSAGLVVQIYLHPRWTSPCPQCPHLKGISQSRKLHPEGSPRTQPNAFSELDFPRIDGGTHVCLSASCMRKNILFSLHRTSTALPPLSPQQCSERQDTLLFGRFHFCL